MWKGEDFVLLVGTCCLGGVPLVGQNRKNKKKHTFRGIVWMSMVGWTLRSFYGHGFDIFVGRSCKLMACVC